MIDQQNHNKKGFTLIELLIVIAVIGVLAAVILIVINPLAQLQKARDAGRKSDIKQLRDAMDRFSVFQSRFPLFSGGGSGWTFPSNIADPLDLKRIPSDPLIGNVCNNPNQSPYIYAVTGGGARYTLFANLENSQDPEALVVKPTPIVPAGTMGAGNNTFTFSAGTCSGKTFNYWINSP